MQIITYNIEGLGECICEFTTEADRVDLKSIKLKVEYAYIEWNLNPKTSVFKLKVEQKIKESLKL